MYKAIVCDFSYSLLGKDDAIAVDVMLEVDRIRNNGAIFIIATGQSPVTIFDYNRSYIFSDYVVAYDGAYVYDLINDKEIYSKKISLANVKKIYSKFKNYNVVFYTINNSYYIGEDMGYNYPVKIDNIDNFLDYYGSDIFKIEIYGNNKNIIKGIGNIKVNYFERVNHIDIVASFVSKCSGVSKIMKIKKIKNDQIISVVSDSSGVYDYSNCFSLSSSLDIYKKKYKMYQSIVDLMREKF